MLGRIQGRGRGGGVLVNRSLSLTESKLPVIEEEDSCVVTMKGTMEVYSSTNTNNYWQKLNKNVQMKLSTTIMKTIQVMCCKKLRNTRGWKKEMKNTQIILTMVP